MQETRPGCFRLGPVRLASFRAQLGRALLSEDGFILPFTIMVALVGVFVAVPVMVLSGSNFGGNAIVEDRTRHYYAADATVQAIIEDLKRGADAVPLPPHIYTRPAIAFGEIVPSVDVGVVKSELLATVKPINVKMAGNPTVLLGFSPGGTGLDLLEDDDSYFQLTDAGTPPSLSWEISSQAIDFPTVSFGSVQITAKSTKGFTKLELFIFNPNDPLHTDGGYNPIPDFTETLDLADVEETIDLFLEDADIVYINSLATKTVKVKVRATRTGGFKLQTDKLVAQMSGPVTTDDRKVQDEPFILAGSLVSGSAADLAEDDASYYKVSSDSTSGTVAFAAEISSKSFTFSTLKTVRVSYVGRSNKDGAVLEMYVFNPNGTGHGVDGYSSVPDLTTTIPLNNTDKEVSLDLSSEDVAYLNSILPVSARVKIRATYASSFQLESDMLLFTATSTGAAGAVMVQQTIQQYIDPGLANPDFATVSPGEGYLLRIWNVHSGLMSVNWARHTADFSQAKTTVMVFRGLVLDKGALLPPGRIIAKPPSKDNELLVSKASRPGETFASSGYVDVDKGLYTVVFWNDSSKEVITDPFAATGNRVNTWVYVPAFKDYLVDVGVGTVGLKSVLRQVPGPTEPPAFPWANTNINWIRNQVYIMSWEPYGTSPDAPPAPPLPPQPLPVASDDWESGGLAGGTGWLGPWSTLGGTDTAVTSVDSPFSGSYHLRLRSSGGYASRSLDLTGKTKVSLRFRARVFSFESGDTAGILVSANGLNWTTIHTFNSLDSDNFYTLWDFSLAAFAPFSQLFIAFDANMNSVGDELFIDDIVVIAKTP